MALFVALGGTAYAVNTVGSGDVINESLLSDGETITFGGFFGHPPAGWADGTSSASVVGSYLCF